MPCTALERISDIDYNMFLDLLRQGYRDMTKMAKIIYNEYNALYPGKYKNWAVMKTRLYIMAKRESFVKDKDESLRGLRPLHQWQIYNANIAAGLQGSPANIKLYWQHEEGWSEKTEVKGEISINADAVVRGVLEAANKAIE